MSRLLAITLTLGVLLWAGALILAAPLVAGGSLPAALYYQALALICHQQPERSFFLDGTQMPVCARCLGLYLSGAAGTLAAWLGTARSQSAAESRRLLVAAALPTGITVALEWLGLASPAGWVRALAALPLGATVGWLLVSLLRAETAAVALPQMRYHA